MSLEDQFRKSTPQVGFEHVVVVFPTTPNQDIAVATILRPDDPEGIYYKVVDWQFITAPSDTPCVYRDASKTRKLWLPGTLYLRCNVASAVCVLELTVKRTF